MDNDIDMDDLSVLKTEFLTEAKEHLGSVEDDILEIENQGEDFDPEVLNRLFRAMHSIKGGSAFLDLGNVKELAHALENVIGSIRNKKIIPNTHITNLLLKGVDKLKILVFDLDHEAGMDISRELSDIQQVLSSPIITREIDKKKQAPDGANPEKKQTPPVQDKEGPIVKNNIMASSAPDSGKQTQSYLYHCVIDLIAECDHRQIPLEVFFKNLNLMGSVQSISFDPASVGNLDKLSDDKLFINLIVCTVIDDQDIFLEALDITPVSIKQSIVKTDVMPGPEKKEGEKREKTDLLGSGDTLADVEEKKPDSGPAVLKGQSPVDKPQEKIAISAIKQKLIKQSSSSIRISLGLLDKLMNYASELVLVRNQNMQAVEAGNIEQLKVIAKKLNVVTSGLQAGILQTRMQAIGTVFSRFTRIVRDLSHMLQKEVIIEIEGQDVELDKNIIEALGDPLTHLVRNAVDHGIELPGEREAAGKQRCGRVLLGAYHKAGYVNIIIRDDGRGMDPARLIESAINKGILSRKRAGSMDDQDAFNLIFKPGFSTADNVTEMSGRGVGMDVVKTNFQKIGGVIQIRSRPGQGTTFDIRLPLTLSIMQALIVLVEDICFAVPQFNISEIVRLYGEDIYRNIKNVNDQEIFSLRGKLIPVIRLAGVLQIRKTYEDPRTHARKQDRRKETAEEESPGSLGRRTSVDNSLYILILNLGNIQYGLIIDTILDTEEIVIKPLHEQIKTCKAYAGTTVLGDGRVAMILDIANIAELAMFNINKIDKLNKKEKKVVEDKQTVLTFNISGKETFAIHLFLISHIEKIRYADIMVANNKEYFKFQERIIRLIRLEEALDSVKAHYLDEIFVIIIKARRPVGILVSRIIDTTLVSSSFEFEDTARPGVIGVTMINDILTMVLDVFTVINIIEPGWFAAAIDQKEIPRKVLLLEDTKFYASLITSYLSGTGIDVIHVKNGKEGIEALNTNVFDLIISDLSMPVMDGFEFAAYVKKWDKHKHTKLIALSAAYDSGSGKSLALEAGFDEYVSKLDRESMLECFKKISIINGDK